MGHVRDAMNKFDSETVEPKRPNGGGKSESDSGARPSAVSRAVQQAEREREQSSYAAGLDACSVGSRGQNFSASEGLAEDNVKPVAAAIAAGVATRRSSSTVSTKAQPAPRFAEAAVVQREKGSMISEQYRILRTNLMARFEDRRFCVMVTSAEAGEGKSVTTVNLALALAELQEGRTLIVDCDLRKGRLAKLCRGPEAPGVYEVLRGQAELRTALHPTGVPNLDILPAGRLSPNDAGELLGRPELAEMVCALRRQYEFVLVDTPPVNRVSDVGMIGRCAGDALMVVRMNRTSREAVNKAMRLLHAVNINVAGLALTHQKYFIPNYIYKYA